MSSQSVRRSIEVDSSNKQTIAQANFCGNGNFPFNIKCQNLANQIQGDGNAVNVIGLQ